MNKGRNCINMRRHSYFCTSSIQNPLWSTLSVRCQHWSRVHYQHFADTYVQSYILISNLVLTGLFKRQYLWVQFIFIYWYNPKLCEVLVVLVVVNWSLITGNADFNFRISLGKTHSFQFNLCSYTASPGLSPNILQRKPFSHHYTRSTILLFPSIGPDHWSRRILLGGDYLKETKQIWPPVLISNSENPRH